MPKRYQIKYISAAGTVIDFDGRPYTWENANNLLDYEWDFEDVKNSGYGSTIKRLDRAAVTKSVPITVYGADGQSIDSDIEYLSSVFEPDVLLRTPGKLYVNDCYVFAYVVGSEKVLYKNNRLAKLELTFVIESPFWIDEDLHRFDPLTTGIGDGFILPTALPVALVSPNARQLVNPHYGPSKALITMYGPVTDPEFSVNTHTYSITGELILGERVEIDQVKRTVTKVTTSGERLNFFAYRGKTFSVFEPIPSGENFVYSSNDFTFDILLFNERSEPLWS